MLALANPWWASAASGDRLEWTRTHRLLAGRSGLDLGYRAHILDDVALGPLDDSLVVLTGPRRIGKSVAMLDAIAALCARREIDPRQIIQVQCDGMKGRDLRRVITLGRSLTASVDTPQARQRIWFFDEISSIDGWTSVVKQARDLSEFGDDCVVATGSRWTGSEAIYGHLMTGRAGSGARRRVRQLLPMTFRDYLAATTPTLPRPAAGDPTELQSEHCRKALDELAFLTDDYDLAWQNYLTSGGFPRATAEHARSGAVSAAFCRDLVGWLRTDIDPDAPQESVPLLLAELAERATSPLNLRHLSSALNYGSPGVLGRRIARMINSCAAVQCHQRDDEGRAVPGAQFKLYLVDPLLSWVPGQLSVGPTVPDFTGLTEAALAVAMARRIDEADEGRWADNDTIGYTRSGKGNEIDLAPSRIPTVNGPATTTPIESKWVDSGWRGESRVIAAKYGSGIVATKSVLDLTHPVWAVPAPLVALLLG
jgi:predicted AAA+ superfamily ATPase